MQQGVKKFKSKGLWKKKYSQKDNLQKKKKDNWQIRRFTGEIGKTVDQIVRQNGEK